MKLTKALSVMLAAAAVCSFAGCGTGKTTTTTTTAAADNSATTTAADTTSAPAEEQGEKLSLTVLTHRTDRLTETEGGDGSLAARTKAFEEANNCTVTYVGYTDYAQDVTTLLSTESYGDVLMIPDTIKLAELNLYFEPLGTYADLDTKYQWASKKMFDNTVYGIAHLGTVAGGLCYNKKVWADAGVTELPKTPEDFIKCLEMIRDNTEAIPYYTNFADSSWTMVQWAALVNSVSGSKSYETDLLKTKSDVFTDGGAYREVYELVYNIFKDSSLIEEDPMTSDWEGCKAAINQGKIATMCMGSWAVSQFQAAGENADDIGYMPAPFSKDGKQYAESTADYCLGINCHSSDAVKALGKKYIEWFVGESNFAQDEGSLCALRGSAMPDYLEAFSECELFITDTPEEALVGVWDEINNDSLVGTWQADSANFKIKIAECAFSGGSLDDVAAIFAEANNAWNTTRDANEKYLAWQAAQ